MEYHWKPENETLIARIDREIDRCREDLARDTIRLIGIKSVKGEPCPGAPFGPGPRQMLDEVMEMGRKDGFFVRDYGVGVVSLAMEEGQPDLGIWLHGDVVPEGEGWSYDPYHAVEYQGCIIGRGATDNKGQLCAIYHLLKIFRRLGIPLKYKTAMYVGSDEESGMHDVKGVEGNPDARGFIHACTPPRLSLVPDSSFPVGIGGKGGMHVTLRSRTPLHGLSITAGLKSAPGKAEAVLGEERIETFSMPRHMTRPDPEGNMITRLTEQLLARPETDGRDRPVLQMFHDLSLDVNGKNAGIFVPSETMTQLTLFAYRIETQDGVPQLTVNIRYPVETTAERILENLSAYAAGFGAEVVSCDRTIEPYLMDADDPVIARLADIANQVTGDNKKPYTLGGGTYAHLLPNAFAFGMDGCLPPQGFPKGRGSAHGLDECVSLDRLQRAMRIYARTMLALNEMNW